jgi:hypothetical protein
MTFDGSRGGRGRIGVISAIGCDRFLPARRINRVGRVSVAIVTPEGRVKVLAAVHPRPAGVMIVSSSRPDPSTRSR